VRARLLWSLHHEVSLRTPKIGEMFAVRRIIPPLPTHVSCDEDWITIQVLRAGYGVIYAPSAVCYNRGPESVREIVRQRTRTIAGQLALEAAYGWKSPTAHTLLLLRLLPRCLERHPKRFVQGLAAVALAAVIRLNARRHLGKHGEDAVWMPLPSTKSIAAVHEPKSTGTRLLTRPEAPTPTPGAGDRIPAGTERTPV
jgi:hypothetical protein